MEQNKSNLTVFILSHGRPNNVITLKTLIKSGFIGNYYIIIDNEDETKEEYKRIYKEKAIVFDKKEIAKRFDEADNFHNRKTPFYARNATFEIAKKLGIKYFIQLDDDYNRFLYRYEKNGILKNKKIKNINKIFNKLLEFYLNINAKSIAMAQGGDFIGGVENKLINEPFLKRKCMNSFICSIDRQFEFKGKMNDDVNTYVYLGIQGKIFFTIPQVSIEQKQTQSQKGGITELYLDNGTYVKSFYTIIIAPSCCKIGLMGNKHKRIHHMINWNNTTPKILEEKYKKQNIHK